MSEKPAQDPPAPAISIRISHVIPVLGIFSALLIAGGLFANLGAFWMDAPSALMTSIFNAFQLDNEGNIPTWYSSMLLAINGFFLLLLGAATRRAQLPDGRYWSVLGGIFLVLSLDETASIHEHIGLIVSRFTDGSGTVPFGWTLVAMPLMILLAAIYLRALFRLPRRACWLIVTSGLLYVGGAMGFEILGWIFQSFWPGWSPSYMMLTFTEETLEFSGQTLFAYTLLGLLRQRGAHFAFT